MAPTDRPSGSTGSGDEGQKSNNSFRGIITDRRTLLQATAAVGGLSLSGCLNQLGGGGSGNVKIGAPLPTSGSFAAYGNNHKSAIKLAVKHANEQGDAGDREVEVEFADTKGDPSTGRQAAQELINNDADFLSGNYSSAVALSIGELAQRRGLIYQCVGGSNAITGSECHPYVFNTGNSAVQQSVTMPYMLKERGGKSVFIIYSDYAWAQSYMEWNKNHAIPDSGGKVVGTQAVPLGTNDWSQPVTNARDSGADHIHFAVTGTDLVGGVTQAFEFGLQKESYISAAAATLSDVKSIGIDIMSHKNFYPGGTVWYWEHSTPGAQEFSSAFRNEYNTVPLNFSACHYAGTRTVLKTIGEVGSTNPDDLRSELEGKQLSPQLWGVGEKYRACDHRATISTMIVQAKQGLSQQNIDSGSVYTILDYPKNPESVMRSCEETGCQME
ncbi:ABC transporter substrate-binding protein [Haladaptatus halobius]|uniref:ABC transporter substrate-binding protein n=1 Tax=Haladaptatus halobius TaxID=2884875 RepID=UPI001D09A0B6|nr:ABC transporter substrate-binding protein [Haladaptatus halobius]